MSTLIACFSAEGTTLKLAEALAQTTGAKLFPIVPEKQYTKADLRYQNPLARCNREKIGKKDVPVAGTVKDFASYDTVLLGFPIWYYGAPNVVNTFCKGYDWTGKRVLVFATSGGSDIGKTMIKLAPYLQGADIAGGKVVKNFAELKEWTEKVL